MKSPILILCILCSLLMVMISSWEHNWQALIPWIVVFGLNISEWIERIRREKSE